MAAPRPITILFSACAFLSSFLLFLIEPLQGKMLLPLFGGAPAVWNTCMVFFQALLLVAYLYAHLIVKRWPLSRQLLIQGILLALPIAFLPLTLPNIVVQFEWLATSPVRWLLLVLCATSGPAFLVVATASPLLQSWYAQTAPTSPAANPYMLYAAGNTGSLLALVGYPLVLEPRLRLMQQSWLWTGGYILLCVLFTVIGVILYRLQASKVWPVPDTSMQANRSLIKKPLKKKKAARADDDDEEDEGDIYLRKSGFSGLTTDDKPAGIPPEWIFDPLEAWTAPRSASIGPNFLEKARWVGLAFIPSSLMLGVTNYMTTDIAAIPLLWMLPLALYVLSFVIVFWRYPRHLDRALTNLMPVFAVAVVFLTFADYHVHFGPLLALHLGTFFLATMICHGRLAASRPPAERLTDFYLWLSLGGVLGGLFNAFAAPLLFTSIAEYPLVLATTIGLGYAFQQRGKLSLREAPWLLGTCAVGAFLMTQMIALYRQGELNFAAYSLRSLGDEDTIRIALAFGIPLLATAVFWRRPLRQSAAVIGIVIVALAQGVDSTTLFQARNFYGVLKVRAYKDPQIHSLVHGGILHGEQRLDEVGERLIPRSYYHPEGPLGQVIHTMSEHRPQLKIGAIGLGTGALAAYGTPDNDITFYELNPAVESLARDPRLFTYVDDCLKRWCHLRVVLGDGRLKLLESQDSYDLIVVDAFNSDAIPVHLITNEALEVYRAHLNPGGVIAFHISNRFVNLEPVLLNLAQAQNLGYAVRSDDADADSGKGASVWAIVASENGPFDAITADERWRGLEGKEGVGIWADDYANVLKTFTWY